MSLHRRLAVVGLVAVTVACPHHCRATTPTIEEALQAYEGAIQRIASYDVTMRTAITLSDEPAPEVDTSPTSAARYNNNNRLTRFRGQGGDLRADVFQASRPDVLVLSGVSRAYVAKKLFPRGRKGSIERDSSSLVDEDTYYDQLFSHEICHLPVLAFFRLRTGCRVEEVDAEGRVRIHAPFGGPDLSETEFRITLDPRYGMMPVLMERRFRIKGESCLVKRAALTRFKRLDSGAWVPVAATINHYARATGPDNPVGTFAITIDESKSTWNVPIPSDAFDIRFPAGTLVNDLMRQRQYVVGPSNADRNLDELVEQAKTLAAERAALQRSSASRNALVALWYLLPAILLAGGVAVWLRRRTTR